MNNVKKNCLFCKLYDGRKCKKYGFIDKPRETCYHCVQKGTDEEDEYNDVIDMAELLDE